jgi:Mrp family chromosome partitioning ATPase
MPTIVFASSKGGVGKSTAAVLLATELAGFGAGVTSSTPIQTSRFLNGQNVPAGL